MKNFATLREKAQDFVVSTNKEDNSNKIKLFDLNKNMLTQILLLCNAQTICRMAQVSKAGNSMPFIDELWQNMVIQDFHFTRRSAENLKSTLNGTYKLVYRCCKEYKLTDIQNIALCEIKKPSISNNYLRGRYWFLEQRQKTALKTLIDDKKMDPDIAISEMEELNKNQLNFVINGVPRDYVVGMSCYQLHIFQILYRSNKLNASLVNRIRKLQFSNDAAAFEYVAIFRHYMSSCNSIAKDVMNKLERLSEQERLDIFMWLKIKKELDKCIDKLGIKISSQIMLRAKECLHSNQHVNAVELLVSKYNIPFETAMIKVKSLTQYEIVGVSNGLAVHDVVGLSKPQIDALIQLKDKGLNSDHLRNCDWFSTHFHVLTLSFLMNERHMDANAAMSEITNLDQYQVRAILKGIPRADVIGLFNHQISALVEFRCNNLAADHLRSCHWLYSNAHVDALRYLIVNRHENFGTAINKIEGLNEGEAIGISLGLIRRDVFGLNEHQIRALVLLKKFGLTANHLHGCNWFEREHTIALKKLIVERKMTIEAAITEISDLTKSEVPYITNGLSRNEVTVLSKYQSEALASFRNKGLTFDHIRECDWFNSMNHVYALRVLLDSEIENYVSDLSDTCFLPNKVDAAIHELNGLTSDEAFAIYKGFSRYEINRLSYAQIKKLAKLKDNNRFDYHDHVLIAKLHLIAKYTKVKGDRKKIITSPIVLEKPMCDKTVTIGKGYLRVNGIEGKGNVYTAFDFSRISAERSLRENIFNISNILKKAVCEFLLTKEGYDYLIINKYISKHVTQKWLKHKSKVFAINLTVTDGYLIYISSTEGFEKGNVHPCLLQALAYIKGIELRIWQLGKDSVLVPYNSHYDDNYSVYSPLNAQGQINLLCIDKNLFEQLKFVGYEDDEIPDAPIYPLNSKEEVKDNSYNKVGMSL